jgi:deoxyguanosine kinase
MNSAIILLGTNMGDKRKNLQKTCELLEEKVGKIQKCSGVYETEPWGFNDSQWFYNCALILQTRFAPIDLIKKVLEIETMMGRKRKISETYESRNIDIDILFYNHDIFKNEVLELPHPRLHLRKFVLLPLEEIASEYVHPVIFKSVREMLTTCNDNGKVVSIGNLYNEQSG